MEQKLLAKMIRRCQKGQSEAFAWLLQQYGPDLYAYFLRTSGSRTDAEDLLQDLFVKLLLKIRQYKHEYRFKNWLFRVAANLVRDRFRDRGHRSAVQSIDSDWLEGSRPMATGAAPVLSPVQQLQKSELLDQLQHALGKLPDQQREIILLRHYGGLSFKQLAEHFDIPLNTALAQVHRGLKKLRRLMSENET